MRREDIRDVKDAMSRMAQRIRELEAKQGSKDGVKYSGSPQTAAVRRASMELTRALSRLRDSARRKR